MSDQHDNEMNRASIESQNSAPPSSMLMDESSRRQTMDDSSRRSIIDGSGRRSSDIADRRVSIINTGGLGVLPGYKKGEGALLSNQKLSSAANELGPFVVGKCPIISVTATDEESLGYRCKCTFQIIQDGSTFHYATRSKGEPVLLDSSIFPIANQRIQNAMEGLREQVLNADDHSPFPNLVNKHLASVSFASSWKDDMDGDCIVTLNYSPAIEDADTSWVEEAKHILTLLNLTQIHVKSKKLSLTAVFSELGGGGSVLRDTIYLVPPLDDDSWQVSIETQQHAIPVHYRKPDSAFFHPNAGVMCRALGWMLDRISSIAAESPTRSRLLEMYCGCGAHSLAIARSGLLASVLAIEYDQRLVDACKANIALNKDRAQPEDIEMSPVHVIRGDAGRWAQRLQKKREAGDLEDHDILLVDPPRQGLDTNVIDLAIQEECIQHVLIISCGLEALVRDLKLLCTDFEIINCHQLDLFPRTDSVETLVHLRRRK